jgi:hypothetical protein
MPENKYVCQCSCGETTFSVQGSPLLRCYCHCTICQEFNQAAFADISIYMAKNVALPSPESLEYKAYRPPPAVQRGKCKSCGSPAVEFLQIPLLAKLIIIPTNTLHQDCVVDPALHMFYNSRVSDVDDGLAKFNGYWKSQAAFGHKLIVSLLGGRASSK